MHTHRYELIYVYVYVYIHTCVGGAVVVVAQSRLTLCDPMDCSSPDSSIHGILQATILEWVTISFSRGSF